MLMMLSSKSFQSHSSPRHPVPSPAPSGGGVTRGARGAQEEPLRRLSAGHSALVTNNTDPFVIEQLHKLELAAGAGTPVTLDPPGDEVRRSVDLDTDGLAPGRHVLIVRVQDEDGAPDSGRQG